MDEKIKIIFKLLEESLFNNRVLIQGCLNIIFTILLAVLPIIMVIQNNLVGFFTGPLVLITIAVVITQIFFFLIDQKYAKKISDYQNEIDTLKKENEQLTGKQNEIVENNTRTIQEKMRHLAANKLDFGHYRGESGNYERNNERITLYYYDDEEGVFIPVARYSENPSYLTPGRYSYPKDQGVIGEAWKQGHSFKNHYTDPTKNIDRYYQQLGKEKIKKEVAEKFTMKARLIFGYRLKDGERNKLTAIIVVESTIKDRYTEDQLLEVFNSCEDVFYQNISRIFRTIIPSIKAELHRNSNKDKNSIADKSSSECQIDCEMLLDPKKATKMGY